MPKPRKTVISPAHGLLLLIDHYKNDAEKVNRLKTLYLCGAEDENDAKEIRKLLTDPILSNYQISYSIQTINNDPTRRYFETHLAYESLKNGLGKIDKNDLERHFESLKKMLPLDKLAKVEQVLRGEFKDDDDNKFKEYADYIRKIQSGKIFGDLSPEDREKIELLTKCTFLAVTNAQVNQLPLNIYGKGIYSAKNKGKVMVEDQETTRNQNLGIMKGHMPIALDDIARSDEEIPYLKPSDQASYVKFARWVESNFNKLVHPFSNSISGTILCQLRSDARLRNDKKSVFTDSAEKLAQYYQLLISAMLFNSGGHSLNEFTAPFSLDAVRKEFRSTKGFKKINLKSMFLTNNEKAFDKALHDAVDYSNTILLRGNLHAQIRGTPVEPKNKALTKFKLTQELNRLSKHVTNQKEHYKRTNTNKNRLILRGLNDAIKHMDNGNLAEAQNAIENLRQKLVEKFGKTNFWGQKSESFKLVESVGHQLTRIRKNFENNMSELQKKELHEELIEPKLERELKEGEDELTVRARSRLKSVKDRLDEVTSLDRRNKTIDESYQAYTTPKKQDESDDQFNRRVKNAERILAKKFNIKADHISDLKERSQYINLEIMTKMSERQEAYRQSLFLRGQGTIAERLDKAWECYNNEERTLEDRLIAQSYLIFVLDISEEHIQDDLNTTLKELMLQRTMLKDINPEYIPGKSPITLSEESKGRLEMTESPGVSEDPEVASAIKENRLLDVNTISRRKDLGHETGQKTEYFDAEQRDMLRVLIRHGKFVTPEGVPFDTSDSIAKHKKGFAAFTLNVQGEFSVFQHRFQEVNGIAHSSMNAAMPVFCAGEVRIENGKLLTITDRSGHYAPSLYNIYKALDYFKKQGVDISETKVYSSVNPGKALKIDVYKSKDYPQFYELNATDLFNSYAAHMKNVVNEITSKLEAYQSSSFKKFLCKVKDLFSGSTLNQDRVKIAKDLAKGLTALEDEINSANTLDSLNAVNEKINSLIENALENNRDLNKRHGKESVQNNLARRIGFFSSKLGELTSRVESAIQTKEDNPDLSDEEILSSSEQLKR